VNFSGLGSEMKGVDYGAAFALFGSKENLVAGLKIFVAKVPAMLALLKDSDEENLPLDLIQIHGVKGSLYGIFAKEAGDAAVELEAV
jgi:hypothetical protein